MHGPDLKVSTGGRPPGRISVSSPPRRLDLAPGSSASAPAPLVLPAPTPSQFLPSVTAVAAAVVERRTELDDAWWVVLCDAATRSRARTDQMAAAVGIGRQRLHQIRAERRTTSRTPDSARTIPSRKSMVAVLGRGRAGSPPPIPSTPAFGEDR